MTSEGEHILWMLISTVLLWLTVPGAALFYGGMVRRKNVLNTIGLPLSALMIVSIEWLLLGEAVSGASARRAALPSSPAQLGLIYDALTASLALMLVTGAIVERTRFSFFLVFGFLWAALVYGPLARWMASGWLANLGCLDFAGGAAIHINAGVSALVAAIVIGPRRGYGRIEMMPNHLPLSFCGAALLWVGWFGFAAGPARAPMTTVTGAFVAIQMSAAAAGLTWMAAEWLQRDKPTTLGTVSGAVAGLVAIAPAAGYVSPLSAIVIGIGAGGFCYMVVNYVKLIVGYDDSLDVFGMHGVGGTWGLVATGLFASTGVNQDGNDGLFYGYPYQFFAQLVAACAAWFLSGAMTWLLLKGLMLVMSPRVDEEAEIVGMDLTQHREKAYTG
ncbi:Ammonium transporter Amt [Nitrospira moscoviensis]|uniref:Ammonium transporter Amt n=2 Tax=Nitrospira moscoviensis TaxID=42253 RepID=A0A0K2G9R0_NITMO|nr:Ammonium transporter Amt [Nitrospira moscoviensis]